MKKNILWLFLVFQRALASKLTEFWPKGFLFLVAFLGSQIGFSQVRFKGLPLAHHFSTEDYQAGIQNWDIYQDPYGLIYVANNFGLLIFDGETWKLIPITSTTRIRSVFVDQEQRVFVGGPGNFGYLEAIAPDSLQYVSLKNKVPEVYRNFDEVWKIYAIDDKVYFCTFEYIFVYDGNSINVIDPGFTLGFTFQVNSHLYTAVLGKGLLKLEGEKLVPLPSGEFFAKMDIRGIEPFNKDQLLIATRNSGFFLMSSYGIEPWVPNFSKLLVNSQINVLKLLSNGEFAVGTQTDGLFVFSQTGALVHALRKGRGLTNSTVLSLFEDQLGNLWAGLNNGLSYIEIDRPFTQMNDNLQLLGTGYTAIKKDGLLYLGTNSGLFALPLADVQQLLLPAFASVTGSGGQVYSLQDIDGKLLMAHHYGGFEVEGFEAEPIEGFEGAWEFLNIPNSESLLVGTYRGIGLLQKNGSQWRFKKLFNGFEESSRKMEMDEQGKVWMTHGYKGVFRLTFNSRYDSLLKVDFYGKDKGFPSNLLINAFKVNGQLVFAAEQSIYQYEPSTDRFEVDELLSGYFGSDHVRELEEDPMGNIYFITNEEVGVLQKLPFDRYEKETTSFEKINHFISDDLENIIFIDRNNILINAKEGFIHYNPESPVSLGTGFLSLIRSIEWNGKAIFIGQYGPSGELDLNANLQQPPPEIPYGKEGMKFRYSSTFYEGMKYNEYQVMLKGFDRDWSAWTRNTEKEYTNLSEGTYTFKVRSRNIYGEISEPMQFTFIVLPPWYRTIYAYAIYFAIFVAVFGAVIAALDRKYRKKQQHLEASSQAVIQEKDSELKAVTVKSEQEITKLRNERLELELKHKNSELASTAMHLINKNEFMTSLKMEIKELVREGKPSAANEKGLQRVVREIEKNIAEDEVWDRFEHHFDQVHGDFIKKLKALYPDLTPQEMKLAAFLRMNMSTKEIAHLLNISVRGVEISRYRLRKKLPLERTDNLVEYMMSV